MERNKPIPRFLVTIDDDNLIGLDFISIVKEPAIEIKALAFAKEIVKELYFSKDKQILAGPVLVPNKVIPRIDRKTKEVFEVVFDVDGIQKIFNTFKKNNQKYKFNLGHTSTIVDADTLGEWIIADPSKDKSSFYGFNLPVGTWFSECHINKEEDWNMLKETEQTGFSVEGEFTLIPLSLSKINNNEITIKLMKTKLKDGTEISSPDETLAVGSKVFVYDAQGTELPAPDGELELVDGTLVSVSSGVVTAIKPVEITKEIVAASEVKLAITPDDIKAIWEAIKPMVEEMLAAEEVVEVEPVEMAKEIIEAPKEVTPIEMAKIVAEFTPAKTELEMAKIMIPKTAEDLGLTGAAAKLFNFGKK